MRARATGMPVGTHFVSRRDDLLAVIKPVKDASQGAQRATIHKLAQTHAGNEYRC
jgi:hypothetical protein